MPKVVKELSDISIKRFRHRVGTGAKNPELKGKPIKAIVIPPESSRGFK
jgi:hypothetical protein